MLKYVAEEIASVATNITGYAIIITDDKGVVIGADSENISRIGELHEASIEVMSQGRMKKHTEEDCKRLKGTYPGITMPIAIHDDIVGSIGIKGESAEVEKYGMLVKMIAEIMLKDRIEAESAHIKYENLQMLVTMIITSDGSELTEATIDNQGKLLGYNLSLNRVPILISRKEAVKDNEPGRDMYSTEIFKAIKKQFNNRQDIIVIIDASVERYLVFAKADPTRESDNVFDKCGIIQKELKEKNDINVYIGISRPCDSIETMKEGYERADMLLDSALLGLTGKTIVTVTDIPLERMLMEAAEYYEGKNLENRIKNILEDKNAGMYTELVKCWCESMFNFAETARRLGIHKNTLTYRFEKMKENFGVDLHDFGQTMAIYLCIKITSLYKEKTI